MEDIHVQNSENTLPNPFDLSGRLIIEQNQLENLDKETENEYDTHQPNFPSCFPKFYHNISEEIQEKHQNIVSTAFYTNCSIACNLCFSILFSFTCFSIQEFPVSPYQHVFMSIFNFIIFVPSIFYTFYIPFYGTFKDCISNTSIIWVHFFFVLVLLIFSIGPIGTGISGLMYCKLLLSQSKGFFSNALAVILICWHFADLIAGGILFIITRPLINSFPKSNEYQNPSH